jgi:hypothetical protein
MHQEWNIKLPFTVNKTLEIRRGGFPQQKGSGSSHPASDDRRCDSLKQSSSHGICAGYRIVTCLNVAATRLFVFFPGQLYFAKPPGPGGLDAGDLPVNRAVVVVRAR